MMRYLLPNNVFGVGISRAALSRTRTIRVPIVKLRMMKNREDEEEGHGIQNKVGANPRGVDRLQQVLHSASDADDGWDKCWKQGLIPWDLGRPTPLLKRLHETGSLPRGTALLPGCGTGYDVVAIACPERYVVGIDISDSAIEKAVELSSSQPNSSYFTFLKADFFTWHPTHLFDLIFDYTFFCAIEPDLRSTWAEKIRDILKPDGELITLMFPISDHVGGPPYNVYEEVLHPIGFKATLIMDNELAVGPRKGREKIGRWKRCLRKSSL
ncbi:probable thiol methyltransferase 2 isoform X2 [Ziziphus jujuba]|uniref:Probable thiol methyltransferase 2 isoform X2 n=1 Tax=Ziziphus jujuba TaxID=326968 RepID=A0A6P3ZIJ1_ZIZJJ|nr:probable thiol methyltransferase 2 isoform X2 [Ziziphus jujuba]